MDEQAGLAGEGKARRWLAGLAIGMAAILALLPATGWIVREQVKGAVRALALQPTKIDFTAEAPADQARIREIAGRQPDDFPLQFAAAARLDEPRRVAREKVPFASRQAEEWPGPAYESLTMRFAGNPSLHANLLRLAAGGEVHANRPEAAGLMGKPAETVRKPNPELNHPETLAAFLDRAEAGERIDPENAYFPAMASIALFAAHRDAEALEALHRAAMKRQWREYYQDQTLGEWRLDKALGRRGALIRTGRAAMLLFPQYEQLRNVARMAGYLAMKAEQAGDAEQGVAIRRDVMRVGSLMRSQGQTLISSLVGMAIVRLAMSRPGGSPPPPGPANEHSEERDTGVALAYQEYLSRLGHGEEAAWVRAEREAGSQVRGLLGTKAIGAGLEYP